MIRKILTTVLCVLLVMALPLSALAATQHTLSIIPGDEIASVDAVTDLFKTLSFRLTMDEDAAAIGIAMDDTDVLTAAMRSDENGVYVQSDSLADGVLYFTWDEIFDAALTSMKELDADEEDTQAVQQALEQAKQQFVTALSTASSLSVSEAKTPEEGMAAVKEMFKDDPVMVSFVEDIYNRMKQTEGEFTSEAHDPATLKMELSITADDYVKICDSKYMRNILETAAEQEFPDATAGEKAAKVDELIAKMKEMYSKSEINIPITILTAEEGNTLISMEMPMVMNLTSTTTDEDGKETEQSAKVSVNLLYNRLTTDAGVTHKGSMSMAVDNEDEAFIAEFDLLQGKDGKSNGALAMLADEEQVTITYDKAEADGVKDRTIAIYFRSDATALIAPAASDRPLMSFNLKSTEVEGGELAAIKAATPETALRIQEMTDEEYKTFETDLQTRLMQTLYTAIGKLPTSVLNTIAPLLQQAE